MKYVLDSSALLSGKPTPPICDCIVSPSVVAEVRKGRAGRNLDFLLEAGLEVREPSAERVSAVHAAAIKTGDSLRVSPADVEALALAFETGWTLLTDDYSMQNLATVMNVQFQAVSQRGISQVWGWVRRCRGCRKEWPEGVAECPDCGSEIITKRKKSS
ncbi:MAG: nucleic acid-binding protein [Methanobacteriota archaeon]